MTVVSLCTLSQINNDLRDNFLCAPCATYSVKTCLNIIVINFILSNSNIYFKKYFIYAVH